MKKLLIILAVVAVATPACRYAFGKRVKGNGNLKTDQREIGKFAGVRSLGPFDVYVTQDSNFRVSVEAEDNLLPYIETFVNNDVLQVRAKEGYWLRNKRDIKVHVSAPTLSSLKSVGSGDIVVENKLMSSSAVEVGATGSGDIKAAIDAPEVKAEILGSGSINLQGETRNFKGQISGSGDIKAQDMKSETVTVSILGSGNANVFASVKLNVEVNGSGDVRYKGDGQVSSTIHGSGSVKKVDR